MTIFLSDLFTAEANLHLYWCPPTENEDPWTGRKLEGEWANLTKRQINVKLQQSFFTMVKDVLFQKAMGRRMKLPIWERKEEIIRAVRNHPVVIIQGSTGCGKTTQIPQFLLDSFLRHESGVECNIVVTQPRRISAISVAQRVAFERFEIPAGVTTLPPNLTAGYSVRFDHVYPRPYGSIMYTTPGHLLRKIHNGIKVIFVGLIWF